MNRKIKYLKMNSKLTFSFLYFIWLLPFNDCTTTLADNKSQNVANEASGFTVNEQERICARMNVSDNSSYILLDREDNSLGLSKIHNSSDLFEVFYSVEIEKECEVTICKLIFFEAIGRKRRCFSTKESQSFNELTKSVVNPDPITSQYFVSTGCSCKIPTAGCESKKCEAVMLSEHECGRLFKEPNCVECRYDVLSLNESQSFIPSNTFWCQSYIIRNGCRLSISSLGSNVITNYTGWNNFVEMDYVRYPNPSEINCICEDGLNSKNPTLTLTEKSSNIKWILATCISAVILVMLVILSLIVRKRLYLIFFGSEEISKTVADKTVEEVLQKFHAGFTTEEAKNISNTKGENDYVAIGYLKALVQPYQSRWEIPRQMIDYDEILGVGQFGKVYKGKITYENGSERIVAVKIANVSTNSDYFVSLLHEIKILSYIENHPNVCSIVGACTNNIQHYEALLLLELCSNGSLKNYLVFNKSSFVEESCSTKSYENLVLSDQGYASFERLSPILVEIIPKLHPEKMQLLLKWCWEIACGMEFLSTRQVVHSDLAARNIFLTENFECKIGDFGLSRRLCSVRDYVRIGAECSLPVRSMAIESLTNLKFSVQSDVWSFAVTLYELFSLGEAPFPNILNVTDLIKILTDGEKLEKPKYCTDQIYEIMLQCWSMNADLRPSFQNLKLFFEKLTCDHSSAESLSS